MSKEQLEFEEIRTIPVTSWDNVRFIALNGPPQCGKTTISNRLKDQLFEASVKLDYALYVEVIGFAQPLKEATHRFFGLDMRWDRFDAVKDKPNPLFGGATPRQAYIQMSEGFARPLFGKDVWSMKFLDHISFLVNDTFMEDKDRRIVYIITDMGFQSEVEFLQAKAPGMFDIVRIEKEWCSYKHDSRQYVFAGKHKIPEYSINNNGTFTKLNGQLSLMLHSIFRHNPHFPGLGSALA